MEDAGERAEAVLDDVLTRLLPDPPDLVDYIAARPRRKAKTLTAPEVAVLAVDRRFHEHIPAVFPAKAELKDVFEANEAIRDGTAAYSGALQAGYFILAVRAHWLAAGPMGGFDAEALDADFFPDGRWHSTLVVNIGHPGRDPWFPRAAAA
jgi:3-hydroxypropanoate dehydrogenase